MKGTSAGTSADLLLMRVCTCVSVSIWTSVQLSFDRNVCIQANLGSAKAGGDPRETGAPESDCDRQRKTVRREVLLAVRKGDRGFKNGRGGRDRGGNEPNGSQPKQAECSWGRKDEKQRDSDKENGSSYVTLKEKYLLSDLLRVFTLPRPLPFRYRPTFKELPSKAPPCFYWRIFGWIYLSVLQSIVLPLSAADLKC